MKIEELRDGMKRVNVVARLFKNQIPAKSVPDTKTRHTVSQTP